MGWYIDLSQGFKVFQQLYSTQKLIIRWRKRKVEWTLVAIIIFGISLFSFNRPILQEPWNIPGKYKKMENPITANKENLAIAKQLYSKHCKSCHGKAGLGDGPKAAELDTPSGDFSTAKFQSQSDGVLFYQTTFGREDMPAYDKKISSDEDRWLIVHYMRSFAK